MRDLLWINMPLGVWISIYTITSFFIFFRQIKNGPHHSFLRSPDVFLFLTFYFDSVLVVWSASDICFYLCFFFFVAAITIRRWKCKRVPVAIVSTYCSTCFITLLLTRHPPRSSVAILPSLCMANDLWALLTQILGFAAGLSEIFDVLLMGIISEQCLLFLLWLEFILNIWNFPWELTEMYSLEETK